MLSRDLAMTGVTEKRVALDLEDVRMSIQQEYLRVSWISTHRNIADPLTKASAPRDELRRTLSRGAFLIRSVYPEHGGL